MFKYTIAVGVAATLLAVSSAALAGDYQAELSRCNNLQTTYQIGNCLGKLDKSLKARVNATYAKATQVFSTKHYNYPGQKKMLVSSLESGQAAWEQYKANNCKFQFGLLYGGTQAPINSE